MLPKQLLRTGVLLLVLCLALPQAMALAGGDEYSVDIVMKQKQENKTITGRIHVKDGKVRQEIKTDEGDQIFISRPDKGIVWMLQPATKIFIEVPDKSSNKQFSKWDAEKEKMSKFEGKETVDGVSCKKYIIDDKGIVTTFWISEESLYPVRIDNKTVDLTYKNRKMGGVSDSLFEMPEGYQKTAMPEPSVQPAPQAPSTNK